MGFTNLREQHAVGQGFFHSGELISDGTRRLRYVYDCGAMAKYACARSDCIKAYLRSVGAGSKLDLLFISHVHADHLNGLPQLLHAKSGLKVDTIVLPYFNKIDRLIGYAREMMENPAAAQNDFYRSFVLDPTATLSTFDPRQIIFVRPAGDDSPGAPDLDGIPDGTGPDITGTGDGEDDLRWKLVGRGTFRGPEKRHVQSPTINTAVATIPDSMGMAIADAGTASGYWLFSPFIDPAIERQRGVFKSALFKALNHGKLRKEQIRKADFDDWLEVPANLQMLVLTKVADLQEAYTAVEKNLNLSSMCLYSGPLPDGQRRLRRHHGKFGKWDAQGSAGIAWLATGDADLKVKKRRAAFLHHYRNLLDEVVTLTVPHHGSEGNFDPELVTKVEPDFCVAAADAFGKWRHPGTKVVQAIASEGRFLSVVTSQKASKVTEQVHIR